MQDKIITNAININKCNIKVNPLVLLEKIKFALNKNEEAIMQANKIDKKNKNGFILDFEVINNICENIIEEDMYYGKIILEQKDDDKKIIYGKQIMDYGNVLVINDGNPYIILEIMLRNIALLNTTVVVTNGYSYGTNNLIIEIVRSVLEKYDIPNDLVQILVTEDYEEILKNYANVDLVVAIGNHDLQQYILNNSKIKTITSGYENFDIYIEDIKHKEFIEEIVNTQLNLQIFINESLNYKLENAIYVTDIDEAIGQINYNGSKYSASIFTNNVDNASKFIKEVKSNMVVVNTSPSIERIIDIKMNDLWREKIIVYPLELKIKDTLEINIEN